MNFSKLNAAQSFQSFIDEVMRELEFTYFYMDVRIITSKPEEEHLEHLRIVFELCKKHGLILNTAKCIFGVEKVPFTDTS